MRSPASLARSGLSFPARDTSWQWPQGSRSGSSNSVPRARVRDSLGRVPLFRRSQDDPSAATTGAAGGAAEADQVGTALGHLSALSVPQRAAEILEKVAASIDEDALAMDQLLAPWLPESDWMALSAEQRKNWTSLALVLREAFQALVLTRMVIRQEQSYKGATWVTYVNSPDGRAALARGDVAHVVARRLPD